MPGEERNSTLVLFDFDGTLTTHDTLFEFIAFARGRMRLYLGMVRLAPVLILYKLGLMVNWKAKEEFLKFFLKGMSESHFNALGQRFADERIPKLLRAPALHAIEAYRKNPDVRMIVVSASPGNWIKCWTDRMGMELIATKLEVRSGMLTGRIEGKNCYGKEKVRRIREHIRVEEFGSIHAYGDTSGDLPMLDLADKKFFKPFRKDKAN
jgi:HAD superfamily hydrolase (TIGR01490 family)